ncbi:tyrosine-type recombinase/integrase [Pedobacter glucosidilyticus]|uniref:tyrosine-type recombinase/integrase n=1 Tax=Pedobacter glucosidilyticus TaxID=1122941 RepID=UPI00041076CB|nr:site-specific integrase [Pedobacter glucosidilyticus]
MASAQIYLDKRRQKADGSFPIKIRVGNGKEVRYYSTVHNCNGPHHKEEFDKIITGGGRNKTIIKKHDDLISLLNKATQIIDTLYPFDFDTFEVRFRQKGNRLDLISLLISKSEKLRLEEKFGNANLYKQAANLLTVYISEKNNSELLLNSITPKYLSEFESWALSIKNNKKEPKYSKTTLSIYMIRVRAIFNDAISDQVVHPSVYPFHTPQNNRGYKIPVPAGNKRALTKAQIMQILNYEALTDKQQQAKDFFIFSYLASGMNLIDIFSLRWSDVKGDVFTFIRKKTAGKTGGRNVISITLNKVMFDIIDRQGNKRGTSPLVFKILNPNASELEIQKTTRLVIASINSNLKKIAAKLDITTDISSYYARHSFSTNLMNNNAPVVFISKQLGHTSIKTTENYLGEFTDNNAQSYTDNLLD